MESIPPNEYADLYKNHWQQKESKSRADQLIEAIRTMNQCEGSHHQEVAELYKELKKELEIGESKNSDNESTAVIVPLDFPSQLLNRITDIPTSFLVNELKKRAGISNYKVAPTHYAKLSVNNAHDGSVDDITGPAVILVVRD